MNVKKTIVIFIVSLFLFIHGIQEVGAANTSQGVYHSSVSKKINGKSQTVNQLSINLTRPYTTIDLGLPSPLTTRKTLTELAKLHTKEEHHVVGAINASFFHFDNSEPIYFLADGKKIVHLGSVSTNYNDFMQTPAAFGVTADNKAKIGKYNMGITISHSGKEYALTSLNRERNSGESVLYTPSWAYSHTRTNPTGLEVVVDVGKRVDQNMMLGEKLSGKVTAIRPYGQHTSAAIPKNGYVISAQSKEEVDKIRDLKVGSTVDLQIDVDDAWKDAKFMLASGPLLVQNGKASLTMDPNSTKASVPTARTAVATDKNGDNAYFVTVDSGVSGVSSGMSLKEFADYLVSIGAYNAINLDGGGSTAMVARRQGNVYPTLVNRPSGGSERSISAILEAISTAPYGQAVQAKVTQAEEGVVGVGASVGFKVSDVLDEYYNVVGQADSSKLVLNSVSNGVGKIENNKFIGVKAGSGTITATYEKAKVSIPITVTDTVEKLVATPTEIRLGPGETTKLKVNGINNKQKVIFNPEAVKWTVSGNLGTVENGVFKAANANGSGTITGTFGSAKVSIPVTVSSTPLVLGSFESTTGLSTEGVRATATISTETKIQPFDKQGAVKLAYDFTKFKEDTSAAYVVWKNGFQIPAQPKKIGLAVYGDGKGHWLRGNMTGADGKEFTVDFTGNGELDWTGWKYVEADIPATAVAPFKLNKIYVAETSPAKKDKGYVLFDQLQAIYTDSPIKNTVFKPSASARQEEADKQFKITFTQSMDAAYLTNRYIYVEDVYGVRQQVTVKAGSDPRQVTISAPTGGYEPGSYRLVATHFISNTSGVHMVKDDITEFTVK